MNDFIIISNVSDDPFAIDIGHMVGQPEEISDIISLKVYANTEFCPRFISDENDVSQIGAQLNGKTIVICSAATNHTRGSLAMRNLILARAAKDNGAKKVILVEPDLYFSAQDRGPHRGPDEQKRPMEDIKKFDGQPFTARLYAELLKSAGVDVVITVHNHSAKVQKLFSYLFNGEFHNLIPSDLYADYIRYSDMVVTGKDGENLVLVAPDHGAEPFMKSVYESLGLARTSRMIMEKVRDGERKVSMTVGKESDLSLEGIQGKDVIVLDDMVRTGSTIVECCRLLRQGNPNKICFGVTHFLSSAEARENLNSKFVDEILTLNTIPAILNRDSQGRLRKKLVVLKIEKWIARYLLTYMGKSAQKFEKDFYSVDMSSKNPRWRPPSRY
ncbi:MAG TPA: phosphoribosyltransferase family protein [Fibrobacteria bacterium]|nr:phosphoribosyltransferase family protein [Fibrobacteria bacterium]